MNIFDKRVAFKPFEYPHLVEYKKAIQHSYWLVSEWNFTGDTQDFRVKLNEQERQAIKRAMLAIAQIEVSVKKFWAKLGDKLPKSEIDQVGIVFGESEVRHSDAYSHLLEVLGLNNEFDQLLENPVIQGRVDYLTKYLKNASDNSNENYMLTLTLFSLFIENVSLFSQFLIIKAFNKHKNTLKDIDNVIQATMREETLHAMFGAEIISIIQQENPSWFNDDFYGKLNRACDKAFLAECAIIDWIFQDGELTFLPKEVVVEFIKDRFNQSLVMIGAQSKYEINRELLNQTLWFDEELHADISIDFFHKKSTAYSKNTKPVTSGDLF